jgi:hypothetical protein
MYENGKMRPVDTIVRMGEGRIKENDGGVNLTIVSTFVNVIMFL